MSKIYRLKRSDIFGRFCVRIDIWWWWWRFWWSDATRLLEVNRSEGEGDPDRASANKMEKRQKDKNTKRQKYKIQNSLTWPWHLAGRGPGKTVPSQLCPSIHSTSKSLGTQPVGAKTLGSSVRLRRFMQVVILSSPKLFYTVALVLNWQWQDIESKIFTLGHPASQSSWRQWQDIGFASGFLLHQNV